MILRPCPACRRHVDAAAAHCVFCATALPGPFALQLERAGRFSRATIFAGATLAQAACIIQQDAPPQAPPPSPPAQSFAQAPPPRPSDAGVVPADATAPTPATTTSLRVTLREEPGGAPIVNQSVHLLSTGQPRSARTDPGGVARFDALPAGTYTLQTPARMFVDSEQRHYADGVTHQDVRVASSPVELELRVPLLRDAAPVRREMPKPYGAPPARRRTV